VLNTTFFLGIGEKREERREKREERREKKEERREKKEERRKKREERREKKGRGFPPTTHVVVKA